MSLEFHLERQNSKLVHINIREEMHGEEPVLAMDLKIQADMPNDFLSYLSPTLKWSLYDKQQQQLELIPDDSHMPHLRYAQFGELRWEGEMPAAQLILHAPKALHDIEVEAKVNQLRLDCRDGGTVGVTFRAQVIPTEAQASAIVVLNSKDVKVSVRPGEGDTPSPHSEKTQECPALV